MNEILLIVVSQRANEMWECISVKAELDLIHTNKLCK